jgi:hypothetical protein
VQRQEITITIQPSILKGAPILGGRLRLCASGKNVIKKDIPIPIIIRPGKPIIKGRISFLPGFSASRAEKPFLSEMMYHKSAKAGSVYVRVRLSSPSAEKWMTPEYNSEAAVLILIVPGKKRTRYKIRGSI